MQWLYSFKKAFAVFALFLIPAIAVGQCGAGYDEIYVNCNGQLTKKCVPENYSYPCSRCWEVRWPACPNKNSGGSWSYDSYERAKEIAEKGVKEPSYCENGTPWYDNKKPKIVLSDSKYCGNSTTPATMPQGSVQRQVKAPGSFGDMDDFFGEELKVTKVDGNVVKQISTPTNGSRQATEGVNISNTQSGLSDDEIWKALEESLGELSPELRSLLQKYLSQIKEALLSGDYTILTNLINSAMAGTPNINMPDISDTKEKSTLSGRTSSASTQQSQINNKSNGSQPSYAIFWISERLYGRQVCVKLNGQYLFVRPGSGKFITGPSARPTCDVQENCDDLGYCGRFIIAKLTQTSNEWIAEEANEGRIWRGKFSSAPGCNIIEIK